MGYVFLYKKLCQRETRKLISTIGVIAICVLVLQTLTLPNPLDNEIGLHEERRLQNGYSLSERTIVGNVHFLEESVLNNSTAVTEVVRTAVGISGEQSGNESGTEGKKKIRKNDFVLENGHQGNNLPLLGKVDGAARSMFEKDSGLDNNFLKKTTRVPQNNSVLREGRGTERGPSKMHGKTIKFSKEGGSISSSSSLMTGNATTKKLMRCNMPPKTVMTFSEMNSLLQRRRTSSGFVKVESLSVHDKELLAVRSQIRNAPITRNDNELYAPLFRNVSIFKRSYELMERLLKVYVYTEGKKPIFHLPILKGLYASEGWFMKLMEGNKKYIVKDPRKAHLFYMPFSTRLLEHSLYVRNSHDRTNLAAYLRNYTNMLAAKYSFWNRTEGADHFFVGCHDWAPYETRHHMERCIKSMCNADVTQGFKIGKDVSFPETYVRSAGNTIRDIGGEPPSNRSILAFFAGSMHGYLRPILLSHWKNKDPDMKIFGRMPFGVASKMSYIRYMQNSKYCICAKGYNVNSPRVVEAIFYECVPVIISDNFVPPFFDILNWEAFSVIVAEKDIPNLKNILVSIPHKKYLALQLAVKKVQRHFIWNRDPVKYDLFHMTLHSIWYSRVFMIKEDKRVMKLEVAKKPLGE